MSQQYSQGAILIIALWFIAIITVMVATLATETRLSAQVVFHHQQALQQWIDTLDALHKAEMELIVARLPPDPDSEEMRLPVSERKNTYYRFDGRELTLAYPAAKGITIRIFDHAGKINLQRLSRTQFRDILEKYIGEGEPAKLDELQDAWEDWIDRDDAKRMNGAEKDYYEKLTPPYEPRNGRIETVKELSLIKGMDEVFKELDMETAFTIYGDITGINPNLASHEALSQIPGLDEESIKEILTRRRTKEFKDNSDFNEFMQPEQLAQFLPWINFSTSNYYTIAIQLNTDEEEQPIQENETTKADEIDENKDKKDEEDIPTTTRKKQPQYAYMVTLQVMGTNQIPKILLVNPYGILPDNSYETEAIRIEQEKDTSH